MLGRQQWRRQTQSLLSWTFLLVGETGNWYYLVAHRPCSPWVCGQQVNQGRLHKLETTLDLLELAASGIEEEITSIYRPSSRPVSSVHHSVPSLWDGMLIQLLSIPPQALSCLVFTVVDFHCRGFSSWSFEWAPIPEQLSVGDELPVAVVPLGPSYRTPTCSWLTSPLCSSVSWPLPSCTPLIFSVCFSTQSWWFIPVLMNSLTSHFIFLLAKLDKFPFSDAINLASGKYYSTQDR